MGLTHIEALIDVKVLVQHYVGPVLTRSTRQHENKEEQSVERGPRARYGPNTVRGRGPGT